MTAPSIREAVAQQAEAIIAREVRCGQDPALPADDQCKVTWLPYKRRCPECPLHYTQRADVAREIADAALAVALPIIREHHARLAEDLAPQPDGAPDDTFDPKCQEPYLEVAAAIRADEGPK